MASIHFRSSKEAVEAFENTHCKVWSLWDRSQFIIKGEGATELENFLDLLTKSGASNSLYTVKYYESAKDRAAINNKTAFDGSFNFMLNGEEMTVTNNQYKQYFTANEFQSKVGALENKLDKIIETMADETMIGEPENKLGIVGDILSHPQIGPMIQQVLMKFLSSPAPASTTSLYPAQRNEVAKLATMNGIGNAIEQDPVLENALSRLLKIDPSLPQRLAKLAALAEVDRNTYNYICSMLDQMNVA